MVAPPPVPRRVFNHMAEICYVEKSSDNVPTGIKRKRPLQYNDVPEERMGPRLPPGENELTGAKLPEPVKQGHG